MTKITIEISDFKIKMVDSPLYWIVSLLTGVAITFSPLFLYWRGKGSFFPQYQIIIVPMCFIVTYFVPVFYLLYASPVIKEIRNYNEINASDNLRR